MVDLLVYFSFLTVSYLFNLFGGDRYFWFSFEVILLASFWDHLSWRDTDYPFLFLVGLGVGEVVRNRLRNEHKRFTWGNALKRTPWGLLLVVSFAFFWIYK